MVKTNRPLRTVFISSGVCNTYGRARAHAAGRGCLNVVARPPRSPTAFAAGAVNDPPSSSTRPACSFHFRSQRITVSVVRYRLVRDRRAPVAPSPETPRTFHELAS
ncbi:hypothetical protein EVAR_37238_1 [Eumeta japonica]|uniref:Uncharacterized protein n=1 Tax=Eumeta variegata TaxID=151549 RepID=A0A4C1Y709_EUMVA|nr:hypothetical protein EVAR_37238_1 [Eumeta japonica]